MTFDQLVATRRLASLESALVAATRALVAIYPDIQRNLHDGEPAAVTIARHLLGDCDHLLAALADYRSQLITPPPKNPNQLDWPF